MLKNRKRLITSLSILVVVVLGVGVALSVYLIPRARGVNSIDASSWVKGVPLPPETAQIDNVFSKAGDGAPMPSPDDVAAALDPIVADPMFHDFTGTVVDAASGKLLWHHNPNSALQSASVMKLLTAQAALLVLPTDHRVKTQTLLTSNGTLILKGYGDVTLSNAALGEPSFYQDAAHLSTLAARTKKALAKHGVKPQRILVDTSFYQGSTMARAWHTADIDGGSVAPMSPVMVDGARKNNQAENSARVMSPATQAGKALARYLNIDRVSVTNQETTAGTVLGTVWSAPLITRLHDLLIHSDNVLAESVGREIAHHQNQPPTFNGATAAIKNILKEHKVNVDNLDMYDASGLSLDNRLSSATLVEVLQLSTKNDVARNLLDDLPVSGGSGTLSYRFQGSDKDARGWIRAKTGTLSEASSLAGIVVNRDGRVLLFAFILNGEPPHIARPGLDTLAATLYSCGCED